MTLFAFRYSIIVVMLAITPGEMLETEMSALTLGLNDPIGYSDWDHIEYVQPAVRGPIRRITNAVYGTRARSIVEPKDVTSISWDMVAYDDVSGYADDPMLFNPSSAESTAYTCPCCKLRVDMAHEPGYDCD
jgi:hypothetical protein